MKLENHTGKPFAHPVTIRFSDAKAAKYMEKADHAVSATVFVAMVTQPVKDSVEITRPEHYGLMILTDSEKAKTPSVTPDEVIVKMYETFHAMLCATFGSQNVEKAMLRSEFGVFADVMMDALGQVKKELSDDDILPKH